MITKDAIESAFCFFHQKQRIYQYSTLDWQKDDIEYAIGDYVDNMNKELYSSLAKGKPHFLHSHTTFAEDLLDAVETLERMLEKKRKKNHTIPYRLSAHTGKMMLLPYIMRLRNITIS